MPIAPPAARYGASAEQTVAEVRFRRRAQARDGAAAGERVALAVVEVRRVHQTPARVHRAVCQQPRDRARAERRAHRVDLARLFRGVQVHGGVARRAVEERAQLGRRHRAQRVRAHADDNVGIVRVIGAQRRGDLQNIVDAGCEAPLARVQRRAAGVAVRVQRGQQADRDARLFRGCDQRARRRGLVGVPRAARIAVDVVELGDGGVAGREHRAVRAERERVQRVGLQRRGERVHRVAPRPEIVVSSRAAALGARRPSRAETRASAGSASPAARGRRAPPRHRAARRRARPRSSRRGRCRARRRAPSLREGTLRARRAASKDEAPRPRLNPWPDVDPDFYERLDSRVRDLESSVRGLRAELDSAGATARATGSAAGPDAAPQSEPVPVAPAAAVPETVAPWPDPAWPTYAQMFGAPIPGEDDAPGAAAAARQRAAARVVRDAARRSRDADRRAAAGAARRGVLPGPGVPQRLDRAARTDRARARRRRGAHRRRRTAHRCGVHAHRRRADRTRRRDPVPLAVGVRREISGAARVAAGRVRGDDRGDRGLERARDDAPVGADRAHGHVRRLRHAAAARERPA